MSDRYLIRLRRRLNLLFDDGIAGNRVAQYVNHALVVLIGVNVASIILESVASLRDRYGFLFWGIERVATAVFVVEYLLRLWTAVDLSSGRFRRPFSGRLAYARGFYPIIDLVSVLPAVLGLFGAADLRMLRLLRLLRILKLTRHSTVFSLLWGTLREEARSIAALLFVLLLTLILSASLMYLIEGPGQPKMFSSIPATMWWAIETLTTVGYGDVVPKTALGKILGGVVAIIGVSAVALFTGVITVSFMDQLRLRREQYRHAVVGRLAAGPLTDRDVGDLVQMAARLDLPEAIAEEAVEQVVEASRVICPNCGHVLK